MVNGDDTEQNTSRPGHRRVADAVSLGDRWGATSLLGLITGYGEKPQRVLAWSVFIVLVFTALFAGFGELDGLGVVENSFATTPPYDSMVGYLIVSLEAFVTLVLGDPAKIPSPLARLFAQIE